MGGKREGENDSFLAGETPLLAYRKATCSDRGGGAVEEKALEDLLAGEPRFHEVHFFMGRLALSEGKLATAEREFFAAADGLPQSVAAWAMLAAVRLALDDSDAAAADFGRALSLEPNLPASLLGQARALNYLGRFEEAIPPAQKLVDGGVWYQSDANYWLAFSQLHVGKLTEADRHVRDAKRTNSADGDTARLAGLIAQRLGEFDRAQSEFELALSRNDADCEARLHLGQIHGVQERWGDSVASFVRARGCYLSQEALLEEKAPGIRSSDLSEARKQIALARLANRVEAARRSQAASSLGAAEGETQRGAKEQALAYLAEAEKDPSLSARVAELRRRLGARY